MIMEITEEMTTDEILEQMEAHPELYADTADPDLVTPVNDILMVNPETRLIDVPATEELIGVFRDRNSARKYFKCPRIVQDNIDLSTCHLFVNYVSSSGKPGQYWCNDVESTADGNYITFSWKITGDVFDVNKDATIYFAVQAKKTDGDNVFNTRKAQGKVYETVDATEQIAEEYADVILQIIERLDNVTEISPEQIQAAVDAYLAEYPIDADPSGTAVSKVTEHNVAADAHGDLRLQLKGLTDRLNALANSDDTTLDQMSEVVAYIKNNKSLIDAITTGKINVGDIINNLTTNVANKPLSAAQGVALKGLIDEIVVPDKLPNPHKLTFAGGVTAEYDGSGAVMVTIPDGNGSVTERIEKASTDTVVELQPNKLYVFPEMQTLTYTLAAGDAGMANEYHFLFQSGATPTEVVHPAGVNVGSLTVEANKIYEISVMENCLTSQSWEMS